MNMHMTLTPTQRRLYEERKARQERIALAAKKAREAKEKPKLTIVKPNAAPTLVKSVKEEPVIDTIVQDKVEAVEEVVAIDNSLPFNEINIEEVLSSFSLSMRKKLTFGNDYSPYAGCMAEHVRDKTMKDIAFEVLKSHPKVSLIDIKGSSRQRYIVMARHHLVYAIRKQRPDISYPQIGKFMGGRDHTTSINSYQKFEEMLKAGLVEY